MTAMRIAAAGLIAGLALGAGPQALAQAQAPAQARPQQTTRPAATPQQPARPAAQQPTPARPAAPAAAAPAATAPAGASAPVLLGQFGDWATYASQTPKTRICYALAQPRDRQPAGLKRDPAFLFVSSRPGEGVRNEVSLVMGFPLKEGDTAVQVGNTAFTMGTKDDNIWIKNPAEEARLVDAMRKGRDLVVKGTSRRGNDTTDTYSLGGLAQALDRAAQECR